MRYFLDTEFIEDGSTIDLISIGIVCEDGRELYLQSVEFEPKDANPWVKENVLPHLSLHPMDSPFESHSTPYEKVILDWAYHKTVGGQCCTGGRDPKCPWRSRKEIRDEIKYFFNPSDGIELWGWCSGYDFVAFCQLFGTMMDLPQGWPHHINDLQQELDRIGLEDSDLPPQKGTAHNALEDARYIKRLWRWLEPEPLPKLSDAEREQWGHILTRRDLILQRDFE